MTSQTPETLYTKSFFTSKEYNLSNSDQLKISEASVVSAKSESIPLDLIEESPLTVEKINPQLIGFTLTCALASTIFYTLFVATGLIVSSIFSGLFFIATLGALFMTNKMKIQSYTYHYANTNTPLFTLHSSQSNEHETSQFVDNLNGLIKASSEKDAASAYDLSSACEEKTTVNEEQKYLAYTYHLDYLFASGLVSEKSYQEIEANISHLIFNKDEVSSYEQSNTELKNSESNVIQFPNGKA